MDMNILDHARSGDLPGLLERLERRVNRFKHSRGKMTDMEVLLDEALTYARLGNLDEATHRLRLAYEPKFFNVAECQSAYHGTMKEKGIRYEVSM